MSHKKGIILAGGSGSRLYPITLSLSKQLLPVYDKPMIYYPITTLMLAGIKDILIITTPEHQSLFVNLLGDGHQWGINLSYAVQLKPEGLAQSLLIAEKFLNGDKSVLILGDNIFFGHGLPNLLEQANYQTDGATIFGYHVTDPDQYGVIDFDESGKVKNVIEKPKRPPSNYAITGLYFFDQDAPYLAKNIQKSDRGEYEITTLLQIYLEIGKLQAQLMGRGFAWFDTGTHVSLLDAGNFVRTMTDRQGLQVGSPDEVAYYMGWISDDKLLRIASRYKKNYYGQYLKSKLLTKR